MHLCNLPTFSRVAGARRHGWRRRGKARTGSPAERGVSLVETLVAMVVVLAAAAGLATISLVSVRSNRVEAVSAQVLSGARAKLEQIQSIQYEQVGINAAGTSTGPGYYVVDPIGAATYNVANGDDLLSDTVTLRDGLVVARTVTVSATDDPADGTGNADFDGVADPNTGTVLDYKTVTITARARVDGLEVTQTLATILRGSLPEEIDGSTGQDSDGSKPKKVQKVSKKNPPATTTDADGDTEGPAKKAPVKKK